MGASLSLPFFSAETRAAFNNLPEELRMRVVRMLLRDEPQAVCCLVSASKALVLLSRGESVEAAELRAARSLLTHQRLLGLSEAAGLAPEGGEPALVRSVSRQPSFVERGLPAPVTELALHNNRRWIVPDGEPRGRAVARFVRVSDSLATLYLGNNEIGDEGAKALAAAVAASGSLTLLDLCYNKIGSEGATALAAGVAASVSLATLRLGYNKIGPDGAKAIAGAVRASGSLATLYLRSNNIGDEGAKALAAAVAASSSLDTLDISGNNIGDEGAKALAAGVAASGSLATLDLEHNHIGPEGAQALAARVAASGSLALKTLVVPHGLEWHAELMTACTSKDVELV